MTQKVFVTYTHGVYRGTGKEKKEVVKPGEKRETKGNINLALSNLLSYAVESDTITTNPHRDFEAPEENRTSLRVLAGFENGNPDDVFELIAGDGTVFRKATRAALSKVLEIAQQINVLKRASVGLVEELAPIVRQGKEKAAVESDGFVVM